MAKQTQGSNTKRAVPLKKIADVITGHTFRSKIMPEPGGSVRVVQLRSLASDGKINLDEAPFMYVDDAKGDFWLKKGDVLFGSRVGSRDYSTPVALVPGGLGQAIAASPVTNARVAYCSAEMSSAAWPSKNCRSR